MFWIHEFGKKLPNKLKPYRKMDKKIKIFDDTEIEEYKFHQYKSLLKNNIDINDIVVYLMLVSFW